MQLLYRKAFAIYMSVKRLTFYLQDAKCTIHCDYRSLEKFPQGKTENNKVNNWSMELSSYKLTIQYINVTKNVIADCPDWLTPISLTMTMNPKDRNLGVQFSENYLLYAILRHADIQNLQQKETYCKCMHNTLPHPIH